MADSTQHKIGRNRAPRVQITYDVEIGNAIEKVEIPFVVGIMADLSAVDAGTNYTEWSNPDWFSGWPEIAAETTDEEQRAVIDRMLEVFYNDPPWLMLYFQPDFYGVSNRVSFEPRRDEKVYLFDVALTK